MSIILVLSTLLLVFGIVLIIYFEIGDVPHFLGVLIIVLSVLIGFGVLGMNCVVGTELFIMPARIYCSTDVGECRIKAGGYQFTTTEYSEVAYLAAETPDSIAIRVYINSYGDEIRSEFVLPPQ